jgi:hypothetical protein
MDLAHRGAMVRPERMQRVPAGARSELRETCMERVVALVRQERGREPSQRRGDNPLRSPVEQDIQESMDILIWGLIVEYIYKNVKEI